MRKILFGSITVTCCGRILRLCSAPILGQPPLRKVVVGKVFRYEEVDATHDNTFTQVEGFLVDKDITVAHLVGTLDTMIKGVLQRDDVEIRCVRHSLC